MITNVFHFLPTYGIVKVPWLAVTGNGLSMSKRTFCRPDLLDKVIYKENLKNVKNIKYEKYECSKSCINMKESDTNNKHVHFSSVDQ